jgi:PAS domain S-box-containing protein
MFVNLINNVAFLVSLVAIGQIVVDRFHRKSLNRRVLLGLLFGGVALLGMANPVIFLPGVIFDGRSMVLVVAGVVGGGVTAAIAAGMAAVYRYQLGGAGAPVGIFVALLPALLGALARNWWQRRVQPPRLIEYLLLGLLVQFIQLSAFTQIPNRAGYAFIEQAWWVLLLFYPLGTMLLCQIFHNHEARLIDKEALRRAQDAVIAEERTSMQRFHAYFDHSIVGLAITSLEKGWIDVNDALCTTLGYTRDELTRTNWAELTHPEDLAADQAQFSRLLAGEINGYAMDKRFIHKDGHLVDTRLAVSTVCKPDGSLDYVVAMVEDVSDRRKAEKEYEDMFREMLDGFALQEIVCDAHGAPVDYRFLAVNPAFERMTGLKAADIVGRTVLEVLPATEKHWIDTFGEVALSGKPVFFRSHYAALGKDFEVKAFRPSAGRFASIFGDVTERKKAEDALRRMVKDLGETQRIAHIGSWHLDLATSQVVWTEELFKMYGFDPLLPVPPYTEHMKLFTPESWERLSGALAHTLQTGAPYTLELEIVRKDGSTGWLWARGEPEVDAAGKTVGLWGAAQDITEHKKTELLLQAQLDELQRWQQSMLGRESRIISIKQEVNELLARAGQPPRYANHAPTQAGGGTA